MNKRTIATLLFFVFALAGLPAFASCEKVVLTAPLSGDLNAEYIFTPWGCNSNKNNGYIITYNDNGNGIGFETAFFDIDAAVLKKGESVRVEAVTTGGVAPYIYEWDVYYQPFAREVRSYAGELHEVSLNSYLDFTPRKDGRYIFVVRVEDSKGNYVSFDSDAIPTDQRGEISEIIAGVAAVADEMPTEFEKVEYIHEWIINNAEYSTAPADYEADSIFLKGCGVCSGYASAFNMLCSACGIDSFSVHGYASAQPMSGKEHSWNCVCIDGDWYFVDVTRDDNNPNADYFLMTSATCEQSYCFGKGAASASPCGGACLPPRCNATMHISDYANDPTPTAVYIKINGDPVGDSDLVIERGNSAQLVCATAPNCTRHASKIWTSSNDNVVRVSNTGIIYAVGVGRCTITATCGELSASVEIIVK